MPLPPPARTPAATPPARTPPPLVTPPAPARGSRHVIATADALATQAGLAVLDDGGSAADAAIAANAVLAVVAPHLCGMGGDLFAIVHTPGADPVVLDAAGEAPAGADPAGPRAEGLTRLPLRLDIRTVTVPGCVDGWMALHTRFGRLPLDRLVRDAVDIARSGAPASPLLAAAAARIDPPPPFGRLAVWAPIARPGVADALLAVVRRGRAGFYEGPFGAGLLALAEAQRPGWFRPEDLTRPQARWVAPLTVDAFGARIHTVPPPSQGYGILGAAALASAHDLGDPGDPRWPHLLVEALTAACHDRPDVLGDGVDGTALLAAIARRAGTIDPDRASGRTAPAAAGDTTYLCVVDGDGMAVSLIQSNASGFGSWLWEPATGIGLHDRGLGFSLVSGNPGELAPHRRPPHTLCPTLVTDADGGLVAVAGTMGGDAQPAIVLQVLARLLVDRADPASAVGAPRWVPTGGADGFSAWNGPPPAVAVEAHAPTGWVPGLTARGHATVTAASHDPAFGHAMAIVPTRHGTLLAGADPRTVVGAAAGR